MGKTALWFAFAGAAIGLFLLAGLSIPRSHVNPNHPLTKLMDEMRLIGIKIRVYGRDYPATEADVLKGKSINDLVTMNVITAADAAYIEQHRVKFFGVDPDPTSDHVPLFEAAFPLNHPHSRIVVYNDISMVWYNLKARP